jgi:hypothetical protein
MSLAHRVARAPLLNYAVELGALVLTFGLVVVALRAHHRAVWSGLPSCVPVRELPAAALSDNPLRAP